MKQTMKKIIAILLLAISASCSKSPVQVVPDDFTGNWYGHSFLKTINGDKQALTVDSPVRFEIRKDGTYTVPYTKQLHSEAFRYHTTAQ